MEQSQGNQTFDVGAVSHRPQRLVKTLQDLHSSIGSGVRSAVGEFL